MEAIRELTAIDLTAFILQFFMVLTGIKMAVSLLEWGFEKLGLETKGTRRQREEHTLIIRTSQNLAALQEQYIKESHRFDAQIAQLMTAQREILEDKINEKYKYYLSLNGIPEDEVEEFTSLHTAYKGVGGNHSGDAKYEYCMKHLAHIPARAYEYDHP